MKTRVDFHSKNFNLKAYINQDQNRNRSRRISNKSSMCSFTRSKKMHTSTLKRRLPTKISQNWVNLKINMGNTTAIPTNRGRMTQSMTRGSLPCHRRRKNKSDRDSVYSNINRSALSQHKSHINSILTYWSRAMVSHAPHVEPVNHNASTCIPDTQKLTFLPNFENANKLISRAAKKRHKQMLLQAIGKQKNTEEYLLNRYELAAEEQIRKYDFPQTNSGLFGEPSELFDDKMKRESVNKITLREKSKRIYSLKVMKSRRLKERDIQI